MSLIRGKHIFDSGARPYISFFLYVVMLNASMVITTIVLHEAGHNVLGQVFGCKDIKIVLFDSGTGSSYTQMNCSGFSDFNAIALGGFLFVVPFGLIFLLMRGLPERNLGLIMIGFNLMASYTDISIVTDALVMPGIAAISGMAMLIVGETLLVNRYIYTISDNSLMEEDMLLE